MSMKHVPPPATSAAEPRGDAFPSSPAGVVEVDVRVDDPGKNVQAAGVDRLPCRAGDLRRQGDDPPVLDCDVQPARPRKPDHLAASDQESRMPWPQLPR